MERFGLVCIAALCVVMCNSGADLPRSPAPVEQCIDEGCHSSGPCSLSETPEPTHECLCTMTPPYCVTYCYCRLDGGLSGEWGCVSDCGEHNPQPSYPSPSGWSSSSSASSTGSGAGDGSAGTLSDALAAETSPRDSSQGDAFSDTGADVPTDVMGQ